MKNSNKVGCFEYDESLAMRKFMNTSKKKGLKIFELSGYNADTDNRLVASKSTPKNMLGKRTGCNSEKFTARMLSGGFMEVNVATIKRADDIYIDGFGTARSGKTGEAV